MISANNTLTVQSFDRTIACLDRFIFSGSELRSEPIRLHRTDASISQSLSYDSVEVMSLSEDKLSEIRRVYFEYDYIRLRRAQSPYPHTYEYVHILTHTHIHTHTYIYIYIFILLYKIVYLIYFLY